MTSLLENTMECKQPVPGVLKSADALEAATLRIPPTLEELLPTFVNNLKIPSDNSRYFWILL